MTKRYCFGNLTFGGCLTEEFLGNPSSEEAKLLLKFLNCMSSSWNRAVRAEERLRSKSFPPGTPAGRESPSP